MIKIKVLEDENTVEIIDIIALEKDKLPEEYFKQKYNIWLAKRILPRKTLATKKSKEISRAILKNGDKIEKMEFQKKMKFIRKAGRKLRKINKAIKEKEIERQKPKQKIYKI